MQEEKKIADEVTFLWNDVATLGDDNCTFIIVKSMVELPEGKENAKDVGEVKIKDVLSEMTQDGEQWQLSGDIILSLLYDCVGDNEEEMVFSLPFKVDYNGSLNRDEYLQEKYIFAEVVDIRHVRIETVLAVPKGEDKTRAENLLNKFVKEDVLTLPEDWPIIDEIIATKLVHKIDENGNKSVLGIIYANNDNEGEKVAYYEEEYPLEIKFDNAEIERAEYYSLSSQVVEDRKVLVRSNNLLYGNVLENKDSDKIDDKKVYNYDASVKENTVPRKNKRDNLKKYMRSLDDGVKSSHIIKNIDIKQK